MTDKEFKRLSRSQLIEIIYQLQLKQDELTADNERLSKALADKRLRVSKAGNIAEAALEIHNVMQAAQDAATHYFELILNINEFWKKPKTTQQQSLKKRNRKQMKLLLRRKKRIPTTILFLRLFSKNTGSIDNVRVKTHETYKKTDQVPANQETG